MLIFFFYSLNNINLLDFNSIRFPSNINVMLKKVAFVLLFLTFLSNHNSYSQSFDDISGVDFMSLNDSQIDLLLRRAGSEGYNQFDLL